MLGKPRGGAKLGKSKTRERKEKLKGRKRERERENNEQLCSPIRYVSTQRNTTQRNNDDKNEDDYGGVITSREREKGMESWLFSFFLSSNQNQNQNHCKGF